MDKNQNSGFTDQNLTCRDCGNQFVWTASEQQFYADKGFQNSPVRCPACRQLKKQQMNQGGGGFGGGRGGGFHNGPRQMYPATCANCGKQTEVPFQPKGDRPVYCMDCYKSQRS